MTMRRSQLHYRHVVIVTAILSPRRHRHRHLIATSSSSPRPLGAHLVLIPPLELGLHAFARATATWRQRRRDDCNRTIITLSS
jgi:hypothetical protein